MTRKTLPRAWLLAKLPEVDTTLSPLRAHWLTDRSYRFLHILIVRLVFSVAAQNDGLALTRPIVGIADLRTVA